ncbi:hypothetical protein ACMDCR_02205 [Labrys okinawensis]|uniref:hypothetical protein n=1 Tax=Labrys okinawensis TaxID=346911 RepID=UPI0039BC6C9F
MIEEAADELAYGSLAQLRAEHLGMLRSWRRSEGADAEVIVAFRRRIAATGAVLSDEADRETAQDFLDYWDAQLLSITDGGGAPQLDLQLAPFQPDVGSPAVAAAPPSEPKPEAAFDSKDIRKNIEASEQLRLSALARQWRQSNRVASYLLSGAALSRAAAFRQNDPEIEAFVAASERRVRERKRRRIWRVGVTAICTLAVLAFGGYQFYRTEISRKQADLNYRRYYKIATRAAENIEISSQGDTSAVQSLLGQVALIDPPRAQQLEAVRKTLVGALKPGAEPQGVQIRVCDALVGNLMHPSVDGLTPSGVENLLSVLSAISPSQWANPAWNDARAGARRAAAWLLAAGEDDFSLNEQAQALFDTLKRNIGLTPPPTGRVSLHFADTAKANAADVTQGLKNLAWQVQAAPEPAPDMPASEVRYGTPKDAAQATLLAADLRKCGFEITPAPMKPGIPAGTLEVWLAGSTTARCAPGAG